MYFSVSDGMRYALSVTLSFYCITEEVMLAEENKNSGRSPLDGKFTYIRKVHNTVKSTIQYRKVTF